MKRAYQQHRLDCENIISRSDFKSDHVMQCPSSDLRSPHHPEIFISSQKAMVAFHMLPLLEAEAKERQRLAGVLYGENHPKEELPEILPEPLTTDQLTGNLPQASQPTETLTVKSPVSVPTPKDSRDQAAAMVGVSGKKSRKPA